MNDAAERILNRPRDRCLSMSFVSLFDENDANWVRRQVQDCLAGHAHDAGIRSVSVEAPVGNPRPIGVQFCPTDDEPTVVVMLSDSADDRVVDDVLRARLAAIDAAHDMIVITDLEGVVTYVNGAFARITGYDRSEIIGSKTSALSSGLHNDGFYRSLWETILAGEVWEGELINRKKDGSLYFEEMSITPIEDSTGEIASFVAIKRDVSRRKETERALRDSARNYREILDGVENAILVLEPETAKILDSNVRITDLLGYRVSEMIGRCVGDFGEGPPFDTAYARTLLRRAVLEGPQRVEWHSVRKDGRTVILEASLKRAVLEGERRVLAVVHDVTEQRRVERALRMTRFSVDCAGDCIFWEDDQGRLVDANTAACDVLGYTREELLSMSLFDIDTSFRLERWPQHWARIRTEGSLSRQGRLRRKDGTTFPVEVRVNRFRFEGQQYCCAFFCDITERLEAEAAVLEQERLEGAVKAMERVLNVVAHELRTPLAGLRATSEFLLSDAPSKDETRNQFLSTIHEQVLRMTDLVNNLLDTARLSNGTVNWNWGHVDLAAVARSATSEIAALIDRSATTVAYRIDPPDLRMMGDSNAIHRLMLNLLSNAQKHTRSGSIELIVGAAEIGGAPGVEIVVSDTGCGMKPEMVEWLGTPFAPNRSGVESDYVSGSGLGFAICKGIVAAHGGAIHVESEQDRGTRVRATVRADLIGPADISERKRLLMEIAA
jgi:PAS domain S-box-containing protein